MLSKAEKASKLIKYLLEGEKVKIGELIYAISENDEIGVVCLDDNYNPTEKLVELTSISLSFITNLAQQISDEEFFLMGANYVLNNRKNS